MQSPEGLEDSPLNPILFNPGYWLYISFNCSTDFFERYYQDGKSQNWNVDY